MNNCAIVLLGASGDLSKRKLLPALYKLIRQNKLHNFIVVGAAFDDTTAQTILEQSKQFIDTIDPVAWKQLSDNTYYHKLNFTNPDDFVALHSFVSKLEKQHNLSGNRIIYLAAASHFFCTITEHLESSALAQKLSEKDRIWHRIVYEKPFGHDLKSAHEINACIAQSFHESQIYRIDHYLTKELVGNIALVRFTNCVFEPLWNNRYIDNVQIILSEKICVEERGAYYDHYGALRDVVQNHMLMLLALVGMESPERLTGEFIRTERAKVLEKVRVVDGVLGQYEGYQQEKNVAPDSTTETFAMLYLMIDNVRWSGVPFYFKTGKCLDKKETTIHIKFKQVDCLLAKNCPSESNYLTIQVTPESAFLLSLNAKKPGLRHEVVPVKMEFCHSCLFEESIPEAYEVLFEEIIRGEQSVSVRFDEIEYAWKIIDSVKAMNLPVHSYQQGSGTGPKEVEKFANKHGMRWRS